jgi:hypothetical protein
LPVASCTAVKPSRVSRSRCRARPRPVEAQRRGLAVEPAKRLLFTKSASDQPREGLPELTEREFDETVTTLGDVGYVVGGRIDRREEAAASTPTSRARAPARRCTAHGGGSTRSGSPGELAAVLEALAADAAIEESAPTSSARPTPLATQGRGFCEAWPRACWEAWWARRSASEPASATLLSRQPVADLPAGLGAGIPHPPGSLQAGLGQIAQLAPAFRSPLRSPRRSRRSYQPCRRCERLGTTTAATNSMMLNRTSRSSKTRPG